MFFRSIPEGLVTGVGEVNWSRAVVGAATAEDEEEFAAFGVLVVMEVEVEVVVVEDDLLDGRE